MAEFEYLADGIVEILLFAGEDKNRGGGHDVLRREVVEELRICRRSCEKRTWR
jgi:hypothetical protein